MKKLIILPLLLTVIIAANGQDNRADMLHDLEKNQQTLQELAITATLKSATRLFGEKNDLTTVIMIIPSGSTVKVTGSDSTYFKVVFEDNEGYILKRHAVINETPVVVEQPKPLQQAVVEEKSDQKEANRFTYLENKYGTSMAAKLNAGKIWKGMTAQMVRDSWGSPLKINRSINGNLVKEEWIYNNTWLYIENNTLVEWGPINK